MNMKIEYKTRDSYEKRYKRLRIKFIIVTLLLLITIIPVSIFTYMNYDYYAFKYLVTQKYIYKDSLDSIYKNELDVDVKDEWDYVKYFDNLVVNAVTKEIRNNNKDNYTYQYLPQELVDSKASQKNTASKTTYEILGDDDILYIKLTNFSKYTKEFMSNNKEKFSKFSDVIIDLRDNYGGDTDTLYYICDLFLPVGKVISNDIVRGKSEPNRILSKQKPIFNYKNIVILQNKNTASSSENMIAALNDNLDSVTTIGATTYGKGIGQTTYDLKNGFAVKATTMLWNTPNNININGKGIKPDIEYTGEDDKLVNQTVINIKKGLYK